MSNKKDNEGLPKSYKLLILWFLSLFVLGGLFNLLLFRLDLNFNSKAVMLFWLYFVNIFIMSLFFMIYKTGRVYYINYITYKEALEATEEERRAFAYKHLRVFCIATIAFIIYSSISYILQYPNVVDMVVFVLIIIVAAIRTVPFRLREKKY